MSEVTTRSDTCGPASDSTPRSEIESPAKTVLEPIVTGDEEQLLNVLNKRISDLGSPLGPWIATYVRRADIKLVRPLTDNDAYRYIQFGHRFLRELKRITADDPSVLVIVGADGLTYDVVIETLLDLVQWTTAQRGAKIVSTDDGAVILLADGLAFAQTVRRRMFVAIDGNGSEPELASALRSYIFTSRREPSTRPAMLTDLGASSQKIRVLSAEVRAALAASENGVPEETARLLADPEALLDAERNLSPWAPSVQEAVLSLEALLPRVDDAIDRLHRAIDGRRLPKVPDQWGRPVQVLMLTMDFVFNAFLRHAATTAMDNRLDQLVRLLTSPAPKSTSHSATSSDDDLPIPATGEDFDDEDRESESGEGEDSSGPEPSTAPDGSGESEVGAS